MKCDWCFAAQILAALILFSLAACADAQQTLQDEAYRIGALTGAYQRCNGYYPEELSRRYLELVLEQESLYAKDVVQWMRGGWLVGFQDPRDCDAMREAYVDIWEVMIEE